MRKFINFLYSNSRSNEPVARPMPILPTNGFGDLWKHIYIQIIEGKKNIRIELSERYIESISEEAAKNYIFSQYKRILYLKKREYEL